MKRQGNKAARAHGSPEQSQADAQPPLSKAGNIPSASMFPTQKGIRPGSDYSTVQIDSASNVPNPPKAPNMPVSTRNVPGFLLGIPSIPGRPNPPGSFPGSPNIPGHLSNARQVDASIARSERNILVLEINSTTQPEKKRYYLTKRITSIGHLETNDIVLNESIAPGFHAQIIHEGDQIFFTHLHSEHIYILSGRHYHALSGWRYHPRDGWSYQGHLAGDGSFSQPLKPGDSILIGEKNLLCITLTYNYSKQQTQNDESLGIRVDALHLKLASKRQVVLLNDISLVLPACTFVALVGGSGTGKSTLMNALSGLHPVREGQVLYNGQDYSRHQAAFRDQLGYVPQDDIVHRDLTVERALYYSARLRLQTDVTDKQLQQRIDEVLEDVEMQERRHLQISKLSGGQRKRVSIALELLAHPNIFFLDEPTSGLDPGLDYRMMHLLRNLADKGQTVVLVTHATSNLRLCDYVCFLAPGGRLVHFGPPGEALTYFGTDNFAQIYSLLESSEEHPDAPEKAEAHFKASPTYQKYIAVPLAAKSTRERPARQPHMVKKNKRGNAWKQFVLLSLRYLELLKNDTGNLLILLLQAPIIAILIMLLVKVQIGSSTFRVTTVTPCPTTQAILSTTNFPDIPNPTNPIVSNTCDRVETFLKHNPRGQAYAAKHGGVQTALQNFIPMDAGATTQTMLFILGITAVLFGCVNAAREIVKEAPIYRRERAVGLGILPYMFSKIVVLALLCLIQSAVLVILINAVDPFQQGIIFPPFVEVYITVALTSLASMAMSLSLSAIAPSTDRAVSFIPVLLIPQIIFAGTAFPFKDWFIQIIAMMFAARWSIGALGTTIGLHSEKLGGDKLFGNIETYSGTLFSTYTHSQAISHLLTMWIALTVMIVFFTCLVGTFLKLKDRRV